jgi:hypothetical protein
MGIIPLAVVTVGFQMAISLAMILAFVSCLIRAYMAVR